MAWASMTTVSGPFLKPPKLGTCETGYYTVSVPMIISVVTTFTRGRAAMGHPSGRHGVHFFDHGQSPGGPEAAKLGADSGNIEIQVFYARDPRHEFVGLRSDVVGGVGRSWPRECHRATGPACNGAPSGALTVDMQFQEGNSKRAIPRGAPGPCSPPSPADRPASAGRIGSSGRG
jgi:hypothetical protein